MANYPQTTTSSFTGDIVLTNGGKAGIGTTTPAEKLDVKGNAVIRGENFTDFGETAKVCVGDTSHYMKAVFGGGLRIGTYQANDAIALQESTGNVGIGTTTPAAKRFATTYSNNIRSRYIPVKSEYRVAATVLSMEWNKMAINTLLLVCW